jgi:hypothetical protein
MIERFYTNITHFYMASTKKKRIGKSELPLAQKFLVRLNVNPCYHLIKKNLAKFYSFYRNSSIAKSPLQY